MEQLVGKTASHKDVKYGFSYAIVQWFFYTSEMGCIADDVARDLSDLLNGKIENNSIYKWVHNILDTNKDPQNGDEFDDKTRSYFLDFIDHATKLNNLNETIKELN